MTYFTMNLKMYHSTQPLKHAWFGSFSGGNYFSTLEATSTYSGAHYSDERNDEICSFYLFSSVIDNYLLEIKHTC